MLDLGHLDATLCPGSRACSRYGTVVYLSTGQIGLGFDLVEALHRQGFLSLPRPMFDQVNHIQLPTSHIQLHYIHMESQAEEDCFRPGPADPCPLAQSVCAPAESFEGVILAWSSAT